jgi:hypothetical protein
MLERVGRLGTPHLLFVSCAKREMRVRFGVKGKRDAVGRTTLKRGLDWIGFIWLRIETDGGL